MYLHQMNYMLNYKNSLENESIPLFQTNTLFSFRILHHPWPRNGGFQAVLIFKRNIISTGEHSFDEEHESADILNCFNKRDFNHLENLTRNCDG